MNKCILCNQDSGFNMICDECKEVFNYYKQIYNTNKKLNNTTELDSQVFEELYSRLEIKTIIEEDKNSIFPSGPDEITKTVISVINETMSNDSWINKFRDRYNNFLEFVARKIQEDYK